jgi:hypothetical protein
MNALPSFEPPASPPRRQKSTRLHHSTTVNQSTANQPNPSPPATRRRSRVKSNLAYAYRRQGLEAVTKLLTYSALSVVGIVTLVNAIGYNYEQQGKLQQLKTELKDASERTAQTSNNLSRSFDPQLQQKVMQENSYKVDPDRRQIFLVNSQTEQSSPTTRTK